MPIESMTKKTKALQSKLRKAQWDPSTPQGQRMRSKHKAAWDPETPEGRARIKRHSEMMTGKVKGGYHQKTASPSDNIAQRECLGCGRMFKSWGKDNRVCGRCKNRDGWQNYNNVFHPGEEH